MLTRPMRRRSGRRVRSSIAVCLIAATVQAQAATLSWVNVSGGAASTAANWSPSQVPASVDTLQFNLNNTFTVTWNSTADLSSSQVYKDGTVTLSLSAPHRVGVNLIVGQAAGDSATARLSTGEIDVSGSVSVGSAGSSTGTLQVNDDDAFLLLDGASSDLTVGDAGNGTLSVTGGGQVQVADDVLIGRSFGSVGNVTVSGVNAVPLQASALVTTGADADISLGGVGAGTGTLTVSDGTLVFSNRDLLVAPISGATGTVTVSDGGGQPAQIQLNRNLDIARNTTAINAGMGTVNINNGGLISVSGTTTVGDLQGNVANVGTLNFAGNGELDTGSLIFQGFTGFSFTTGVIRIFGGTFDPPGAPGGIFSMEGTGNPTLELNSGAHGTLAHAFGNALRVGVGNPATLRLISGGTLSITTDGGDPSDAQIGAQATLVIDGANSALDGDRNMSIAAITTDVTAGGRLESFNLSFSGGASTITGTNSRLVAGGALTNDGTSTLALGTGAAGQAGSMNNNAPLGIATGATLTVTNTMTNSGPISLTGGTITAGTLDFNGTGNLIGRGTVTARVLMDSPTAFISNSGGSLNLGNSSDTAGFFSTGTLNIGGNTARLFDLDVATVGNVTMAGGVLECANGGLLAAGTSITGSGRVQHALTNQGTITPSGTGLQWAGLLTGTGQGISGTTMRFLAAGGFSGAGLIDADVTSDSGSTLTATGALTMGRTTSTSGISFNGALNAGAQTVTLRDSNTALLGNVTLAGGTLNFPNGGLLAAGRTLSGSGLINDDMTNQGAISSTGPGLLVDGILSSAGPTITGDMITFGSHGGLVGSGLLDLRVSTSNGATIQATGALTMGRATSTSGITIRGSLDVGAQTVTLLDADEAQLGTSTTLAGGTLVGANGLLLTPVAHLSGTGTLDAAVVDNQGFVAPGSSIGTLRLTKDYTERGNPELAVEIGGPASFDVLDVGSTATVNGTLRAAFVNGFTPALGDRFPILSAADVDGTFGQVVPSGLPAGMTAIAQYTSTRVFVSIVADADGDGSPDFTDCAPADPGSFAVPADPSLTVAGAPSAFVSWTSQIPASGPATVHDLIRGELRLFPVGSGSEVCLVSASATNSFSDAAVPDPGRGFFYLSRGRNACATPPYGTESDGTPRVSSGCP